MNRLKLVFFYVFLGWICIGAGIAQTGDLLVYYPFNGNADDESGNGNNGTVMGAALTQDRFGNDSSAYSFNGVDNYIAYSVLWSTTPDSITVVAWFKVDTTQYDGKVLYHGDNGEIQLFVSDDSAAAGVHLGQSVADPWYYVKGIYLQNEWQMMTAIWIQGESFRLYSNSVLVDSVNVPADELVDPGPGYQPSIGSYGRTLGAYFKGMIDDIRIYGRALTPGEIAVLYNEGTSSVELVGAAIPTEFELFQNYPNPFNPSTTISFSIPENSFVKLRIFNSLGEEVETVVNRELSAGNYKYDWNAINLPSGIYFYKLQTEKFNETKKMVLIK